MSASYVYGVFSDAGGGPFSTPGVEQDVPPHLVTADGLAAIVSPVASAHVRATRRNLRAHGDVLAEAVARGTVLPLRFGVVLAGDEAVHDELLCRRGAELNRLLDAYEGTVEMAVRAVYDEEEVLRHVTATSPSIVRLRDEARRASGSARYYARIRLGEAVAAAVESWRANVERKVLGRVRPTALDERLERELPERVAVKASFLVERERRGEFDDAVDDVARELAPNVRFTSIGPLALHSFAALADVEPVAPMGGARWAS
ncbi:MAG: GvpL/GvpF family gas vesicle protein [Actinomycetota bacterium]|nr:GvpL/GvpF family gas vesicle protein [Actinomycetota bacterium]